MSEGKYIEEVHRRLCEQPDGIDAIATLMRIANETARRHPVWYERFLIATKLRRVRAWLMYR